MATYEKPNREIWRVSGEPKADEYETLKAFEASRGKVFVPTRGMSIRQRQE